MVALGNTKIRGDPDTGAAPIAIDRSVFEVVSVVVVLLLILPAGNETVDVDGRELIDGLLLAITTAWLLLLWLLLLFRTIRMFLGLFGSVCTSTMTTLPAVFRHLTNLRTGPDAVAAAGAAFVCGPLD